MKNTASIVWVVPGVTVGSGGMRTIVNAINELVSRGHQCTVLQHCEPGEGSLDPKSTLMKGYGLDPSVSVQASREYNGSPDCMVATWWATAYYVLQSTAKTKAYFVQDFEPMFYAASEYMLAAERTYSLGFEHIVIGRGLARKLRVEYNAAAFSFDFGVDFDVYRSLGRERERAVCALYQPAKPHRCTALLETSLKILHAQAPDAKIYLYGSNEPCSLPFVEHLGLLDLMQCNELYNKCSAGLCLSASNPSRIPFEMMAAGLPVVDLYGENTLYDYGDGAILLAECTPEALAGCMLQILDDHDLADAQAAAGLRFIEGRSMKREVKDIADLLEAAISGAPQRDMRFDKSYTSPAGRAAQSQDQAFNRYGMFRDGTILVADAVELVYEAAEPFVEGDTFNAAVWSNADQSDLIWFPCEQIDTARARCIVNGSDFGNKGGVYQIHLYCNNNGANSIITQTSAYLTGANDIPEIWGYASASEAGNVSPAFRFTVRPCAVVQKGDTQEPVERKRHGLFRKMRNR